MDNKIAAVSVLGVLLAMPAGVLRAVYGIGPTPPAAARLCACRSTA